MKESYEEGSVGHRPKVGPLGPESYAGDGNKRGCGNGRGTRRPAHPECDSPKQEQYEVILHVQIGAGGGPKGPSLPRHF